MTHDEVIAWIDEEIAKLNELINNPCAWGIETEIEYRASLLANRDVLERHRQGNNEAEEQCQGCFEEFPCPTYQDIYNRIREVM